MQKKILGVEIDFLSREKSLEIILGWMEKPKKDLKVVATINGEFLVLAEKDKEFFEALRKADLATADGVSVLAAKYFLEKTEGKKLCSRFWWGFQAGCAVLQGKVVETVSGVWLFENLMKKAGEKGYKVFLLGGEPGVAEKTAKKVLGQYSKIKMEFDAGEKKLGSDLEEEKRVIKKINDFEPDLLCVVYDRVGQYKWLEKIRSVLEAKVAIGLGGTFNEYLGLFPKAPCWMERVGLKWLWRLVQEPKRIDRIWRAVVVFPWKVYTESSSSTGNEA